jgi:hypothetical protein
VDRHAAECWTGIMPESWTGFAGMRTKHRKTFAEADRGFPFDSFTHHCAPYEKVCSRF